MVADYWSAPTAAGNYKPRLVVANVQKVPAAGRPARLRNLATVASAANSWLDWQLAKRRQVGCSCKHARLAAAASTLASRRAVLHVNSRAWVLGAWVHCQCCNPWLAANRQNNRTMHTWRSCWVPANMRMVPAAPNIPKLAKCSQRVQCAWLAGSSRLQLQVSSHWFATRQGTTAAGLCQPASTLQQSNVPLAPATSYKPGKPATMLQLQVPANCQCSTQASASGQGQCFGDSSATLQWSKACSLPCCCAGVPSGRCRRLLGNRQMLPSCASCLLT